MTVDRISQLVRQVSDEEVMSRFRKLHADDIIVKSEGDVVSTADFEAEKRLTEELKALYPGAMVCGEEAAAGNPGLLADVLVADHAFLIDPVDGTNNYVRGSDKFAVMLVELKKAAVVASWIYLPASDRLAVAEKGAGTYLNDQKVTIPEREFAPAHMVGAVHLKRFPEPMRQSAKDNMKKFQANRPAFCAGYDYVSLLTGDKDFSVYFRTLPWDHLPGTLIFSEAGGYSRTLLRGEAYVVHDTHDGLLSAHNADHWHRIRDSLFPDLSDL